LRYALFFTILTLQPDGTAKKKKKHRERKTEDGQVKTRKNVTEGETPVEKKKKVVYDENGNPIKRKKKKVVEVEQPVVEAKQEEKKEEKSEKVKEKKEKKEGKKEEKSEKKKKKVVRLDETTVVASKCKIKFSEISYSISRRQCHIPPTENRRENKVTTSLIIPYFQ
jgi:hypothetical protein